MSETYLKTQIIFSVLATEGSIKHYVVRVLHESSHVIGTWYPDTRFAYFAVPSENGTATQFQNFDVLLNPHDCDVTWVTGNQYAAFRTKLAETSYPYLGRCNYEELWYPGSIDSSLTLTSAIDNSTELIVTSDYQYLISSSTGFELEVRDFEFGEDIFGGDPTVMGYDEIHNLANCTITQTLVHSQTIRESKTVVMSLTKTSTKTDQVGLNLGVYNRQETKTETYIWTNETTIKTETELTISVSREVFVPPLQSVIVCSAIYFVEDFHTTYIAKAIYKAKSLTPSEIISILSEENINGLEEEDGHAILKRYDGEFMGSIALNTQFIVSPVDSLEGCKQLVENSDARMHQKFLRLRNNKQNV